MIENNIMGTANKFKFKGIVASHFYANLNLTTATSMHFRDKLFFQTLRNSIILSYVWKT